MSAFSMLIDGMVVVPAETVRPSESVGAAPNVTAPENVGVPASVPERVAPAMVGVVRDAEVAVNPEIVNAVLVALAISVPPALKPSVSAALRNTPVFVSPENAMPGDVADPAVACSWPVIAAWPSRGRDPVISVAMSVKLAFIADELMVVPDENELAILIVPEPLRAKVRSFLLW